MRKRILLLSMLSSLLALQFVPSLASASHEAPTGGAAIRVPLVPAFEPCIAANSTHGAPLNFPSCSPPVPVSNTVKSGPGSIGYAFVQVCSATTGIAPCNEAAGGFTSAMRPDVRVYGEGRDIQCRGTAGCAAGTDYNPNGAAGPYTTICGDATSCGNGTVKPAPFCAPGAGSSAACIAGTDITATANLAQAGTTIDPTVQCGTDPTCLAFASKHVGTAIRVSDHYNCFSGAPTPTDPNACPANATTSNRPATLVDIAFPIAVDCITNPAGGAVGSNCGANTTANAVVPGSVIAGKVAVVEVGEIQQLDSGPNLTRGDSDDEIFSTQGLLLP